MLIHAIVPYHDVHPDTALHPLHLKMLLELVLMCWLFAVLTLASAWSDDAKRLSVDAGFYDLQRAHSTREIVVFGQKASFRKYFLVRMLGQYTLVEQSSGGDEYTIKDDGTTKTIVIY
jgi:hypothetical protein